MPSLQVLPPGIRAAALPTPMQSSLLSPPGNGSCPRSAPLVRLLGILLACALSDAESSEPAFVLRGTLREQHIGTAERRAEGPFELIASEAEFRIRLTDPSGQFPRPLLFASDYRSSYLSSIALKDGTPNEHQALASIHPGMALAELPDWVGFVTWAWLASRLPASGEGDQQFLALSPPRIATRRSGRYESTVRLELVRSDKGKVTAVKIWIDLGNSPTPPASSASVFLAAELIVASDAAGLPLEAALSVYAVAPRAKASVATAKPVQRLSFQATVGPLDDPTALQRLSCLPDRDPRVVFVKDYRFPEDSHRGYRSYRLAAGQPIPFDPEHAPLGSERENGRMFGMPPVPSWDEIDVTIKVPPPRSTP